MVKIYMVKFIKIVKICMVKFNVSISNRLKIMVFLKIQSKLIKFYHNL